MASVRPRIRWQFRSGISVAISGMQDATRTALEEAGKVLKAEAQSILSQKGSGRTYTHAFWYSGPFPVGKLMQGKRLGTPITASAPGQPPAKQTGELMKSVKVDLGTDVSGKRRQGVKKSGRFTIRVGTNSKIGRWLEFDWRQANGRIREARPWLKPATERAKGKMRQEFKKMKALLKARLKGTLAVEQTAQKDADRNPL